MHDVMMWRGEKKEDNNYFLREHNESRILRHGMAIVRACEQIFGCVLLAEW
jgi:hypothetical protein